ncbi:MAG: amino acid adenylation domain-containing protein, partial [Bacteroidota bacterium]
YMIPSQIVEIDKIPLNANGKVNRKALPDPEIPAVEDRVAPSSEMERQLLKFWAETLQLGEDKISIHSNFFELGGHSLLATTLVNKIKKHLEVEIQLRDVFTYQDIYSLGIHLEQQERLTYQSIPRATEKEFYPLSSGQKRLYFLNELDNNAKIYNIPSFKTFNKRLGVEELKSIFDKLIDRHETLRTSIHLIEGEPRQQIHHKPDLNIEYFEAKDVEVPAIISNFVRPFELDQAPLLRVGLIVRKGISGQGNWESILLVDIHHLVADGLSVNLLFKDVLKIYSGEELPHTKIRYRDFVEWQEDLLKSYNTLKQRKFWLDQFAEEVSPLNLPTDHPRPLVKQYEGNVISFYIDSVKTQALKEIAEREGATMFIVLLSMVNVLLSKLSGKEDIVVGTPTGGRFHEDTMDLVGMFANTVVLRNFPKAEQSYLGFLSEVKANVLACFDNQNYPYEELVSELEIPRDTSRNPLFDVMFSYLEKSDLIDDIGLGANLDLSSMGYTGSQFDLTFKTMVLEDEIKIQIEYASSLFEPSTIERFITYYQNIVSSLNANPNQTIGEVEILPPAEKEMILKEFNATELPYPSEKTIIDLFEAQVTANPDHVAIHCGTSQLSYVELKERVDEIATFLRERQGIQRGELVGLMLERNEFLIPAILGVLKAGGAYVLVESSFPLSRISYIIEDSQLKLLVLAPSFASIADQLDENLDCVCIDKIRSDEPRISRDSFQPAPTDLAYVNYTSGSTGKPKGVMIEHRNLTNFIFGVKNRIPFKNDSTFLCLTSVSFDIFMLETLLPLAIGAKIVLANSEEQKDLRSLSRLVQNAEVDIIQITPSRLKVILYSVQSQEILFGIKHLLVGGEAFPKELLEHLRNVYDGEVFNMYGPTETTIWSTIQDLTYANNIDIGSPIANTQIRILDQEGGLAPIGAPGELCIVGDGVARGYWRRKVLTEERFITDPYGNSPMYRTGDLARWLRNGQIEFLGRNDDQIKLRGIRIELGEIENQLTEFPSIKEGVILAKGETINKYLVAYYIADQDIDIPKLKSYLLKNLPEYMVPSYFIPLDEMPLNTNGKLDRKALPTPILEDRDNFVKPSNSIESSLQKIWSEVLGIDQHKICVNKSFFELGGHSLIIPILISSIERELNVSFHLRVLFQYQTIASLSNYLKDKLLVGKVRE